jgi:outer membrane lipoprotein-sorting protein
MGEWRPLAVIRGGWRWTAMLLAWTALTVLGSATHADAGTDGDKSGTFSALFAKVFPGPFQDGERFINRVAQATDALKTYSFRAEMDALQGRKLVRQVVVLNFKKPHMIRVKLIGSYKRGSEVAVGPDGKARGHMGGVLSPFTVGIDPRSDLLLGANGYPMMDSDLSAMLKVTEGFLKQGMKARVSTAPLVVSGAAQKLFVVEIARNFDGAPLYKRFYVEPQTFMPVEWFDYQDGKPLAHTIWKDLRTDIDLSDDFFEL